VGATELLGEIRAMGYTGSANLLVRYLDQGRADDVLPNPVIRRLTGWIMSRPGCLSSSTSTQRDKLARWWWATPSPHPHHRP